MCCQIPDALVCLILLINTIEVIERERDVFSDTGQKRNDLLIHCGGFAEEKQDYADTLAALDERHGAGRNHSALDARFPPRFTLLGVEDVFVDLGGLSPERLAANPIAISIFLIDREPRLLHLLDAFTSADHGS